MRRAIRFAVALVMGLALVTWLANGLVHQTTRAWFDRDVTLRAQLAVSGARRALAAEWNRESRAELRALLTEIAHDERIMGAAACTVDETVLARTDEFPDEIDCAELAAQLRASGNGVDSKRRSWTDVRKLAGGDVHVSAIPMFDGAVPLGFVVLVQDLSFIERREAKTRQFLLLAFAFLAISASGVTLLAARLSWRGWTAELMRSLRGGTRSAEFKPVLRDVRDLVDRIVAEKESDQEGGSWTPERLKQTLARYLHGEKVIIMANREPYIHMREENGATRVFHPASGLVTALEPVLRACSGVWIAHGSGTADRETSDRNGRIRVPPDEQSYVLRRVWLTPEQENGYYYGFSNEGLWPLCHIAHARPIFRARDWGHYQDVNRKFADVLCQEVDSDDPIVLVQDYHFALVPALIRARLPEATVMMFWHVPWPNSQHFGICPWDKELLEGMLGASILGFHTQFDCNNFLDCVDRYLEARIDREQNAVIQHGRRTLVRPYPISLEWPNHWVKTAPPVEACRDSIFRKLGLPPTARLGVGVDRLDYTKGVEERLLAVERLLERYPEFQGNFSFVQLAAPSRTAIERYRHLNEDVERATDRINRRFGRDGYQPIILLREHHEPPTVFQYYRAADVCYVSSLHDGMNLVAKEFVAAREDERGVLVLSQFTGAARELTEALIVNPYNLEEASEAIATALRMPAEEQADRMRSMRAFLAEFNVYRWAGRMLVDAARLRRRDRLSGRLVGMSTSDVST